MYYVDEYGQDISHQQRIELDKVPEYDEDSSDESDEDSQGEYQNDRDQHSAPGTGRMKEIGEFGP